MTLANCQGQALQLFFPTPAQAHRAGLEVKEICRPCPVWIECLAYGIAQGTNLRDDHGIYAATSPTQRNKIRKDA